VLIEGLPWLAFHRNEAPNYVDLHCCASLRG